MAPGPAPFPCVSRQPHQPLGPDPILPTPHLNSVLALGSHCCPCLHAILWPSSGPFVPTWTFQMVLVPSLSPTRLDIIGTWHILSSGLSWALVLAPAGTQWKLRWRKAPGDAATARVGRITLNQWQKLWVPGQLGTDVLCDIGQVSQSLWATPTSVVDRIVPTLCKCVQVSGLTVTSHAGLTSRR